MWEPDSEMAEILQLSDQELETTGISTPRTLVGTVEATQGRTVMWAETEGPEATSTASQTDASNGLILRPDGTQPVTLKTGQQKLPKLKGKEKQKGGKKIQELWDNFKGYKIHITKIPEEERTEQKKYLK